MLRTITITAGVLLLSVSFAFAVKESDMNKYSMIFCRHYLEGGGKNLLDAESRLHI